MSNILKASSAVIAPYDATKLKVTVSEVTIDTNGNATIAWSCTLGGTARAVGSSVAVPVALKLSDQIYMRPRISNSVSGSC
jgi:Flp pilus assembly protein TadG